MSMEEKLKSAIRAAHSRANAIAEESKHIQLPENPAAWISDIESFAASLPDEIPQKEKILRYSQFASAAIRGNNEPELRRHILSISRLCEDADFNHFIVEKNTEHKRSEENGRNGGRTNKRRKWADEAAKHIARWEDLPEDFNPLVIETDECDYEIYRDGERIFAFDQNTGQEIGSLARSTFEKRYL